MDDSGSKGGAELPGAPLTKEQRRELLAQIEGSSSRTEAPEEILQRVEQEMRAGRLDAARRLLTLLEGREQAVAGFDLMRRRLEATEAHARHLANARKAEDMLVRYIQQRKKPLAKLALDALLELEPEHPRKGDFKIWIDDLDEEVALQKRIDAELDGGRAALHAGDLALAKRRLDALRKLDPDGPATELFAGEIEEIERGQQENADIGRRRQRFEAAVAAQNLEEAERELAELSQLSVPKVTLDFLGKRLEEARGQAREVSHLQDFETEFRNHLAAENWQAARDVAHEVGRHFRGHPRSPEMFDEVSRLEAGARRRQSIEQGIQALESFLSSGQRSQAELALRVLQGLDVDPQRLAELEARVKQL